MLLNQKMYICSNQTNKNVEIMKTTTALMTFKQRQQEIEMFKELEVQEQLIDLFGSYNDNKI